MHPGFAVVDGPARGRRRLRGERSRERKGPADKQGWTTSRRVSHGRRRPPDPPLQWLVGAMSAYVDPDELMLFSVGMVLGVDTIDYMVDVVLDRRLTKADHRKLSLALQRKGGKLPVRVDEVVHLVSQPPSARPN